jgi:hypothetical protein
MKYLLGSMGLAQILRYNSAVINYACGIKFITNTGA